MKTLLLILFSVNGLLALGQQKTSLLGSWSIQIGSRTERIWTPSNTYQSLYQAGYTDHPFVEQNDQIEYLIFDKPIEYRCEFSGSDFIKNEHIELVFEGLDTYAEIILNDKMIGSADNAFRTWTFDISELMKRGKNELIVRFTSPKIHHQPTLAEAPYLLATGNEQEAPYTRKAAYQFGWDWAPKFIGSGIWRPAYLRSWNKARITDFYVETLEANETTALIAYKLEIESDAPKKQVGQLVLNGKRHDIKLKEGLNQMSFQETIKNPKLWYPNGYGTPNMHLALAHLVLNNDTVDASSVHYGIRTVELVNQSDSIGTSFYFKVNGQNIFAKGANYVPMSSFPSERRVTDYRRMLEFVKEANMNMLRVWGGGIYEDEQFYKFCDENGILIWQDFMFANATYPSDAAFHANIKSEAEQNVIRLRKHPCIALWCGNNEIEVAWRNWGWQKQYGWTKKDSSEIWKNYQFIFEKLLPGIVETKAPSTPYVSSSPQSNWGKKENFNHGSMHYWGVWHGQDDFQDYQDNVGRFMVEYGFQSYPSYEELSYYSRGSFDFGSKFLKNRQKSYVGDKLIIKEIQMRYGTNTSIRQWLSLSQYIQAIALKEAIQHHRLNAPKCMGTLFWQLNDWWPGASWSIIDYHFNKKVAYGVVKNQFSESIAVVDTVGQEIQIWATTDSPETKEATLDIQFYAYDSLETFAKSIPVTLKFLEPKIHFRYSIDRIMKEFPLESISLKLSLRDRHSGNWLFRDKFYFGLSPEEKAILNN